jgi:hypothetical protein
VKLWHVVQWGNPEEGGNGDDGQCIISASSLESAVARAEQHFQDYNPSYMAGKCHIVHLLGQDDRSDGEAVMINYRWLQPAVNPGKLPTWHRHENSEIWEKVQD